MPNDCHCDDLRAIMALQAKYCQLCDTARWDEYRELFLPDAVMHCFGRDYVGAEAITAFTARRHLGKHMLSVPDIEIDGDEATVAVDHAFYRYPDLVLFGTGIYRDVLRRTENGWKFARREVEVHGYHSEMTAAAKQSVTPIADSVDAVE